MKPRCNKYEELPRSAYLWLLTTGLAIALLAGCAPGESTASVSGKVTYKSELVPVGTVSFITEKSVASGPISNGEYTVARAPLGDVKITVSTPAVPDEQQQKQMKQKVEGKTFGGSTTKAVAVPQAFSNPDSSGLTYKVTPASPQTHDIEIK